MKTVGSVWSSLARRALERRVARVLGMDREVARELLMAAWRRDRDRLTLRAAAFVGATTRLSPYLVPPARREQAIRGFVRRLLAWPMDDPRLALAYAGHQRRLGSRSQLLPP